MQGKIAVATSIAPRNIPLQQQALASWQQDDIFIISLNTASEIESLQPHFPQVHFVEPPTTGRALYGRDYVFFDDVLIQLNAVSSEVSGIINSDIHLRDGERLREITSRARHRFVALPRQDVRDLSVESGTGKLSIGFDAFFFPSDCINLYPKTSFCLGLPAWDYWAPIVPYSRGISVEIALEPVVLHIEHPVAWRQWGPLFADSFSAEVAKLVAVVPEFRDFQEFFARNFGQLDRSTLYTYMHIYLWTHCLPSGSPALNTETVRCFQAVQKLALESFCSENSRLQRELHSIQSSLSWKITRPLRWLKSKFSAHSERGT